jgi:hypothetical protein
MVFFGKPKMPLTDACARLSVPENVLKAADNMSRKPSRIDNRAVVLSLLIMGAAGDFVEGLRWDAFDGMWKESRQFFRRTNMDVITAEAIVWITFLMGRLWHADQKKDREMFERIGHVTVTKAGRLSLRMIESLTGIDFTARAVESRKLYFEAMKEAAVHEAFATVVFRSVGCRSLADPLKHVGPLPPPEWSPLAFHVTAFFSTIPSGVYETFKNMLREWPDRFPDDDNEDFEEEN